MSLAPLLSTMLTPYQFFSVFATSFNIRAYADENETKVTLLEGKIAAQINERSTRLLPANN